MIDHAMNRSKSVFMHQAARMILALVLLPASVCVAQQATSAPCANSQPTSYPTASITNGQIDAVLYLPDAKTGYYRGARFDWSGVVGCLAYKGHTYFGVWFPHYDPQLHDAITGPVEEFRSANGDSALKYDEAKPGDPFVKIGVGVLRKIDDSPFKFAAPYPIIDGGKWAVQTNRTGATYRHTLKSPIGIAYEYTKTLALDQHEPVLVLSHALKNTGKETIDTQVYDHDFYMLDNAPTGPDMVVRFPFELAAAHDLGNGGAVSGKELVYSHELETGVNSMSVLTGYSGDPSSYDFIVENRRTGVGVEQTGDQPLSRINFWSIRTTICPEAYVHIKVAPGETAHWTIRYRFYAK
jgi:hypothetical protein